MARLAAVTPFSLSTLPLTTMGDYGGRAQNYGDGITTMPLLILSTHMVISSGEELHDVQGRMRTQCHSLTTEDGTPLRSNLQQCS